MMLSVGWCTLQCLHSAESGIGLCWLGLGGVLKPNDPVSTCSTCYQAHISILFKEVDGLGLYSQTKALPVIWIGETWTPPGGEIFVSDGKKFNICMCNSKNTWYQYTVFSLVKRLGQCLDHTIHISLFWIDKGRISKRMYILAGIL